MTHLTRIRIAALSAALFLGGLTAAGFGLKATQGSSPNAPVTTRPRSQVVHETRTRTVHVRTRRTNPSAGPPVQTLAAARPTEPVSQAQAPAKVQSRVSPTGGEHESDEADDGGEVEAADD